MANNKEQQELWAAAAKAIGRILRNEFEPKQHEMPDHMRQLLALLDEEKRKHEK
jgi:hypothetical protein